MKSINYFIEKILLPTSTYYIRKNGPNVLTAINKCASKTMEELIKIAFK